MVLAAQVPGHLIAQKGVIVNYKQFQSTPLREMIPVAQEASYYNCFYHLYDNRG